MGSFVNPMFPRIGTCCDDVRRANIYFNISSPAPGAYLIALHYKGREQAILEMDLKIDDLLERQVMGLTELDLEYVKFDVQKTLVMLKKI